MSQLVLSQNIDSTSISKIEPDSISKDSISFSISNHQSDIEDQVEYDAEDSTILDLNAQKAYLYGKAQIIFQDIKLNADYIDIDFRTKDVFATGIVDDSTQNYIGRPAFDDNGKIYEADTMKYNFESKKGISYGVLTTEKDGYIHGKRVLRDSQENIYVKDAQFTTCNLPNPHRGNLQFSFNRNEFGEPESPSFRISNDYSLRWNYTKDAKSRPGSNFSANVNFVTSSFLKNNTTNYNDIISTNSNSSVSYSRGLFNRKINLSIASNINQNLSTGDLTMTLPQMTANMSRQMPFKSFNSKNKTLRSFLRNFGVSYQGTFRNEIRTIDTTLIGSIREQLEGSPSINTTNLRDNIKNGISHRIPISTSFKALKWITVSPNISFDEYWYLETTEKRWNQEKDSLITNTIKGFDRAVSYRTSISLSTILYGMKIFKKESKLQAIRHVIRPNMSAVYSPDFSTGENNGYRTVQTDTPQVFNTYSIYENGLLGRPSSGPQASINFGVGNNLEIKIKSSKDTTNGGIKKIKIIENLNIRSGYNFLADSFNLSTISINGNTTILNKIRMTFGTSFDPYQWELDEDGTKSYRRKNYALNTMNTLGHFTQSNLSISTNLNPEAFKRKSSDNANEQELEFINNNLQNYVDFNIPWSLNINYNMRASRPVLLEKSVNQSITFNGDIKLTENWKIGLNSGYDISKKELSLTSINFYRDLHCWQMNFEWYPIGRQMFSFGINVKSSTLQDLKLNRRRSWFDF
ncbi:MAG: hypothetical protein EBR72_03920 [Bacteroidetes bacterium]|nr:hypothetical protein [Bacteroidota bacterium]